MAAQLAFNFEIIYKPPVIETPKPIVKADASKLDSAGHAWWASLCRSAQENCISETGKSKDATEVREWAELAKTWKALATKHEAEAFDLEGVRG